MSSKVGSSSIPFAVRTSFVRCIQKRLFRTCAVCTILFLGVTIHLTRETLPQHHAPFEAPETKLVVHGDVLDGLPEPADDLQPFPYSPMIADDSANSSKEHTPWLAAVISTASDVERRMLIRSTWMRLYEDVPFDGRFVVSNPGPRWMKVVSRENNTFGDMIVLDHIQEDDVTANTIKTLEFYKWLVNKSLKYDLVSKMDTDLWLNARGFWDRFLQPRLSMNNESGRFESTINRTVIGELYYSKYWDLTFPHGAMYTVTWDMVELLSSLQEKFKVVTGEDMAVGTLMLKGRERASFINFKGSEKFDYDDRDARQDGSAWARKHTHPNSIDHALVEDDPIAVHQLKDEAYWFKVANCFDEDGVKAMPPQSKYETQRPMSMRWHDFWYSVGVSSRYESRFDKIPEFLWTLENGDWICDGIWNLGKTKTGFVEE
uniref:Hexosyltransferase n=2 Tax=Colletotrichum fructicola (strain Nara gc5) TaxID=1213859 RepID=L2FZY6_COLFN